MIERILVALDGSELAETVLPYVEHLAARTGAGVRLLTVVRTEPERLQANSYLMSRRDQLRGRAIEACSIRGRRRLFQPLPTRL